jgi:tetratricopeptide (TPR) repeat protein
MKIFLVLLTTVLLLSCASKRKPERPKLPPGSREPPISAPTEELTPERKASNALIDEGQQALDRGLYDRAADLFQESVAVDPTNGAGYYYLALVKLKAGEYGEAWDFTEKAETLLPKDSDWIEKIEALRQELNRNQ